MQLLLQQQTKRQEYVFKGRFAYGSMGTPNDRTSKATNSALVTLPSGLNLLPPTPFAIPKPAMSSISCCASVLECHQSLRWEPDGGEAERVSLLEWITSYIFYSSCWYGYCVLGGEAKRGIWFNR